MCSVDSYAGGDDMIEMIGAAKCISQYGIVDLNEILSAIQLNPLCDVTASRSLKARHYFQVPLSLIIVVVSHLVKCIIDRLHVNYCSFKYKFVIVVSCSLLCLRQCLNNGISVRIALVFWTV